MIMIMIIIRWIIIIIDWSSWALWQWVDLSFRLCLSQWGPGLWMGRDWGGPWSPLLWMLLWRFQWGHHVGKGGRVRVLPWGQVSQVFLDHCRQSGGLFRSGPLLLTDCNWLISLSVDTVPISLSHYGPLGSSHDWITDNNVMKQSVYDWCWTLSIRLIQLYSVKIT